MNDVSSKQVSLVFYNFQPVCIKEKGLKECLEARIDRRKLEVYKTDGDPSWLNAFKQHSESFSTIASITVRELDSTVGNNGFRDSITDPDLQSHIVFDEVKCYLLFDYKSFSWVISYEIPCSLDLSELAEFLEVNEAGALDNTDLYNRIRNLMVRSESNPKINEWIARFENRALDTLHKISVSLTNDSLAREDFCVVDNTGNITNITDCSNLNDSEYQQCKAVLLKINRSAERLRHPQEPIELEEGSIYSFNGRFHTILIKRPDERYRYVPIQFQMQRMWFYLRSLFSFLTNLNDQFFLFTDASVKNLDYINLVEAVTNRVQNIRVMNEQFKSDIETDRVSIYDQIEKNWNIENLLAEMLRYVDSQKDALQRLYLKLNEKSNDRQSRILFIISIIQIAALLSVWGSYIELLNEAKLSETSALIQLFGSIDNLLLFNTILPIFLILGIALMLYLAFFKKKDRV
ncbi:MAG: hypothetical protein FWE41_03830 [Coriobacteriia bacterium]|nr:hypothetical protein [Coriobacteriia bacterium]MCL2750880.1 hypothetical protein [Coriobacteriia bacterium]